MRAPNFIDFIIRVAEEVGPLPLTKSNAFTIDALGLGFNPHTADDLRNFMVLLAAFTTAVLA